MTRGPTDAFVRVHPSDLGLTDTFNGKRLPRVPLMELDMERWMRVCNARFAIAMDQAQAEQKAPAFDREDILRFFRREPTLLVWQRHRDKYSALTRHIVFWILNIQFGWSLAHIGRKFGRDHTTVRHGVIRVSRKMAAEPAFAEEVRKLCRDVAALSLSQQKATDHREISAETQSGNDGDG